MEQIEVGPLGGQGVRIGKPGAIVLAGESRDLVRGVDRVVQRTRREIAGAGMTAPLPDVDRDPDALVACLFDRLDLALAHVHRQTGRLGGIDRGIAGAEPARDLENLCRDLMQPFIRVVEHRDSGARRGPETGAAVWG
jgi:hypothetical protein